ncbi:MAG: hypothetical protein ABR884_02400 [Minisyncoccia bacterium]|jgi:hypothetical protein
MWLFRLWWFLVVRFGSYSAHITIYLHESLLEGARHSTKIFKKRDEVLAKIEEFDRIRDTHTIAVVNAYNEINRLTPKRWDLEERATTIWNKFLIVWDMAKREGNLPVAPDGKLYVSPDDFRRVASQYQ